VRAVTLWALLGSFDWDSLVTRPRGHYEPGAFDLRGPGRAPRPTALAGLARDLAAGREPAHPCLDSPGWWHRPERLFNPAAVAAPTAEAGKPLLVAGATGTLGRAFARLCAGRGIPCRLLNRAEFDIASPAGVAAALEAHRPWAVVNAAGYVRVDDAEREPDRCLRENALGPRVLAEACGRAGIGLLTFSSDLVFDGQAGTPYPESAPVGPLSVYGRSKAEAERAVLAAHPAALVVRTSAFFGPWDGHNFVAAALRALRGGGAFAAADDLFVSPTYVPDLVHASLDLLLDGEAGVWHLANAGAVTWADLARRAARAAGLDEGAVVPRPAAAFGWPAPRPAFSALGSERGHLLPTLDDALGRYLHEATPVEGEPCPA
jgi:dTDP-4-dehydrorhamnose reductase